MPAAGKGDRNENDAALAQPAPHDPAAVGPVAIRASPAACGGICRLVAAAGGGGGGEAELVVRDLQVTPSTTTADSEVTVSFSIANEVRTLHPASRRASPSYRTARKSPTASGLPMLRSPYR